MSLTPEEKKQLSESDCLRPIITPAVKGAGWDPFTQIRREVTLTPGPIIVRGNLSSRNKKKKKFADYVLSWEPSLPVAVLEAKDNGHSVGHGMQQALGYADIMQVPTAFSSNGDGFEQHNKHPSPGEPIETSHALNAFPSPSDLWERYKAYRGIEDGEQELLMEPYHDDGSGKEPMILSSGGYQPNHRGGF